MASIFDQIKKNLEHLNRGLSETPGVQDAAVRLSSIPSRIRRAPSPRSSLAKRLQVKPTSPSMEKSLRTARSIQSLKEPVPNLAKEFLRAPIRGGATLSLAARGEKAFIPGTGVLPKFERLALGDRPVENIRGSGETFLSDVGATPKFSEKFGLPVGAALTAADTFPDFFQPGGGRVEKFLKSTEGRKAIKTAILSVKSADEFTTLASKFRKSDDLFDFVSSIGELPGPVEDIISAARSKKTGAISKRAFKTVFDDLKASKAVKGLGPEEAAFAKRNYPGVGFLGDKDVPLLNVNELAIKAEKSTKESIRSLNKMLEGVPSPNKVLKIDPQTLNVNRLNIPDSSKKLIADTSRPRDAVSIKNAAVIEEAKKTLASRGIISNETTLKEMAGELAARSKVVALQEEVVRLKKVGASDDVVEGAIRKLAEASKVARSQGTDAARKLQARNIIASNMYTPMQKVFGLLDNAGVSPDEYAKAAAEVDFNDAKQVVRFYRKFVKPGFWDYFNELRYSSMLSSVNTHIVNAVSNVINSTLQVPRKTLAGGFDWALSGLTGKQRQEFVSEVPKFIGGSLSKLPEAVENARKAIGGEQAITNLDVGRNLPVGGKFSAVIGTPTRILEAGDQFFKTMLRSGEASSLTEKGKRLGKSIRPDLIQSDAEKKALETLFRQKLGSRGQGFIVDAMDNTAAHLSVFRKSENPLIKAVANVVVPFIQTPTNILKQGVEYSPLGFVNLIGSKGRTADRLAKATIGSMVSYSVGNAVAGADTTWDIPENSTARAAFYAAGKVPYSIKIGDKWASFQNLGPIGYPVAMAVAIKEAVKTRDFDDNSIKTAGRTAALMASYFTDQSYMRGLGDLLDAMRGDEYKINRMVSSPAQQSVPFGSFLGWVSRIVDPIYRKVDYSRGIPTSVVQNIQARMPFASKKLPPYISPTGEPQERKNLLANQVSPFKLAKIDPGLEIDFQRARGTKNFVNYIDSLEPEKKREVLIRAANKDSKILGKIISERERRASGLSSKDTKIKNMGIRDGSRAVAIAQRMAEMKTTEERKKFLIGLDNLGALNKEVLAQVVEMRKQIK
jgi:hypothetical protein